MSTPKAHTLQQRFGFMDQDLTTPKHDAIMAWLDRSMETSLEGWLGLEQAWPAEAQAFVQDHVIVEAQAEYLRSVPAYPVGTVRVDKKIWEAPVMTDRKFIVGFLDLLVWYVCPYVTYGEPYLAVGRQHTCAGFEVKTTIPSLGELFRQLSIYRAHFPGKIVVVSPDTRHAKTIIEQGYGFVDSEAPHD